MEAYYSTLPGLTTASKNHCPSARRGLAFYRIRASNWKKLRGVKSEVRLLQPRGCAHTLWLAKEWKVRAFRARQSYYRWLESEYVLKDTLFGDGNHAWLKAVREVQRPFPGTEGWLLSCSDAEGGHGRWVGYSGVPYSIWLRNSDTVGGPMQFRYSTFTGMYHHGLDHLRARGYRSPRMDMTTAWRSALGQAIAAGWARYTGNDNSHWSASWGNGC